MTQKPILFVTGQHGMVGQYLSKTLADQYQIYGLERIKGDSDAPSWRYHEALQKLNIKAPDAVIHLAGAGIADHRWNQQYKQTIHHSRVEGTRWLVDEIMRCESLPETFMCASAIGYYGHRPGEILDEFSAPGENFVSQVASHWEQATRKLNATNCRIVQLRFGMILSATGGALKDMLGPFKWGAGGKLGTGQQHYSWVTIDDVMNAIEFLLTNDSCMGAFNLTSPHPITNQTFTKNLAQQLNRPAFTHMPAALVRLIFGEMADELLLADAKVMPKRLVDAGFEFKHEKIEPALEAILE